MKHWRLTFIIALFIFSLIIWRWFSVDLGKGLTAIFGLLGFGGEALVRKVKKRAKENMSGMSDADILADINRRKRRDNKRTR